jgi:hypothetical protein
LARYESSITDSYATGAISGDNAGGIAGEVRGTLTATNSHYDSEANSDIALAGDSASSVVAENSSGLTTAQLADTGIRDAILNGGDLDAAIADFVTRNTPSTGTGTGGDPGIPANVVDYDTAQKAIAAAAQVRGTGQQMTEDALSGALAAQTASFENARVPLDQLMAHLTQGATTATTPNTQYGSGVRGVSVDEERYTLEEEKDASEEQTQ